MPSTIFLLSSLPARVFSYRLFEYCLSSWYNGIYRWHRNTMFFNDLFLGHIWSNICSIYNIRVFLHLQQCTYYGVCWCSSHADPMLNNYSVKDGKCAHVCCLKLKEYFILLKLNWNFTDTTFSFKPTLVHPEDCPYATRLHASDFGFC